MIDLALILVSTIINLELYIPPSTGFILCNKQKEGVNNEDKKEGTSECEK